MILHENASCKSSTAWHAQTSTSEAWFFWARVQSLNT